MGELSYDSLDPGDALSGASLTTRFSSLTDAVNALDEVALAPGGLNENHLVSGVSASGATVCPGAATYNNSTAGLSGYPAFKVINIGGSDLEVDLGVLQVLGGLVGGVLVMADLKIQSIRPIPPALADEDMAVYFQVEASILGAGPWVPIAKSRRNVGSKGTAVAVNQYFQVALRTLITNTEMASGLRYVRVSVSIPRPAALPTYEVVLRTSRLAVLSLHSKKT
jgi:hypothetical protein